MFVDQYYTIIITFSLHLNTFIANNWFEFVWKAGASFIHITTEIIRDKHFKQFLL